MNRLNIKALAMSILLVGTTLAAVLPARAQPMMGDMGMHHNEGRLHERMTKHWEQRQTELKSKLHLATAQEPAWHTFVQEMKVPAQTLKHALDREALAKLTTTERLEKMNAIHDDNLATMQSHIKQRTNATRTFYNQLSVEQQKMFDAETLPEQVRWNGKRY